MTATAIPLSTERTASLNYSQLIAEHAAIDAAMAVVLRQTEAVPPCPADVSRSLEGLANLLRDHLAGEDDVLYQTVRRARGGRHAEAADHATHELERLKDDWTGYLYRWDPAGVAGDWPRFAAETADMMARIHDRIAFETMILYSLALHHDVIAVE